LASVGGVPATLSHLAGASFFGRNGGDGDLARLGLVAHAGRTNFGFPRLGTRHLGRFFPILMAWAISLLAATLLATSLLVAIHLPGRLAAAWPSGLAAGLAPLGRRLVHQVEDTEVVLGVLKIPLRHDPVTTAGRVTAQLQVLFEQLLGGAADPDVWPIAVEDMVPIEWNPASSVMAHTAATATAATPAATSARAMVAASHAFHVHTVAVLLSRCGAAPS
jgi:hypothetical protein